MKKNLHIFNGSICKNFRKFTCIAVFLFASCKDYTKNKSHLATSDKSIEAGKQFAKLYCSSCHLFPDPSLLDSKSWENGVLPAMAEHFGIFYHGFKQLPIVINDKKNAKNPNSNQPTISLDIWQNIVDYYAATSPDSLPPQTRENTFKNGSSFFKVETPFIIHNTPATCYVKINTTDTTHAIMISDLFTRNLYFINRSLQVQDSIINAGTIVNIDFNKNGAPLACDIGVFNPNNGKFGSAQFMNVANNGKYKMDSLPLFDSLQRPVQITESDLNGDGKPDYLICEFGYITGSLSWMENKGNNQFARHILRPIPGAMKAYINDFNHDGLPDIMVLFAQGDESIILFTNKGNGEFGQEQVLRFPPSYGSSYFELDDFNKDGFPDILYTCGDNADYSPVLKPYHGVYIFMNDGTNHFTQKYFFPINGCYKAMARDFDNDGNLDIAAISFFADYAHQPEEGFVYLKNTGGLNFLPYSLPGTEVGRWLTMDVGDIDGDGKTDIVLGNFSVAPANSKSVIDWKKGPPFIVLKNIGN